MTWPHVRRSCDSNQIRGAARPIGISSAGVGLQSPVPPRVGRDGDAVWSARRSASREERNSTLLSCSFPSEPTAGSGNVRRFPESELISAQPATRQATDPICHLHNPAIRTQTPGAGRASHVTRRKCCRGKCIQCVSSGVLTKGPTKPAHSPARHGGRCRGRALPPRNPPSRWQVPPRSGAPQNIRRRSLPDGMGLVRCRHRAEPRVPRHLA